MTFQQETIDKHTVIPLYYQLKQIILQNIKKGHLEPDDMIPTEQELGEVFQISRTTIRQAIMELVSEGYLYRVKGKGTFVAKMKIDQDFMKKLEAFNEQIERKGLIPSTKVLEFEKVLMDEAVAEALQMPVHSEAIKLVRLRFASQEPIVIVETYLPYEWCAHLFTYDMNEHSLYEILEKQDETKVQRVVRTIEAITAGSYESKWLDILKGSAIQLTKTIGYNASNQPIEYSIARYRGDRNQFTLEIQR
ncbi:GntR family transcriptional regulator [Marinicrinis sediminis]|uniref:GntR family transcriptional regulator n=1 Tax=Marinicrinis sediminis TaxID=1652465 RepID=A0ABW5RAT0_9BACL